MAERLFGCRLDQTICLIERLLRLPLADCLGQSFSHPRCTMLERRSLVQGIRNVRDRFVKKEAPPARALIGVTSLFHPDVLVEADAIAALP
jgi:hypothetical protein